tara:strand:+ start:229 stop:477 length:249 start_codon:yes stop_codon:yes gene_type:complete
MIQLIAAGDILNKESSASKHVPPVGSTVIYKTFRENERMTNPVYDIQYVVVDVIYETQETWNDCYKSVIKVYLKEVKRVQIR